MDVEDPVATAETVRADTEDVKWAMLRRVVHLASSLPASVADSAGVVALLLLRRITDLSRQTLLVDQVE